MNTTTKPQPIAFPTIEQARARHDAERFYSEAEQAIAAGYDAHADKMLRLYLEAALAAESC